jgi:Domain of unknown function (DUF3291)
MRRPREWFERMAEAYLVLWWVPRGHRPGSAELRAPRRRRAQLFFAAASAPMRRLMFHCCAIDKMVLVTQ